MAHFYTSIRWRTNLKTHQINNMDCISNEYCAYSKIIEATRSSRARTNDIQAYTQADVVTCTPHGLFTTAPDSDAGPVYTHRERNPIACHFESEVNSFEMYCDIVGLHQVRSFKQEAAPQSMKRWSVNVHGPIHFLYTDNIPYSQSRDVE